MNQESSTVPPVPDGVGAPRLDEFVQRLERAGSEPHRRKTAQCAAIDLHWRLVGLVAGLVIDDNDPPEAVAERLVVAKALLVCLRACVDKRVFRRPPPWADDLFDLARYDLLQAFRGNDPWRQAVRLAPLSEIPSDCNDALDAVLGYLPDRGDELATPAIDRAADAWEVEPTSASDAPYLQYDEPGTPQSLWGELGMEVSARDGRQLPSLEALIEAGRSFFRGREEHHA